MSGQRAFDRLAREVLSVVAGRLTAFHLVAVMAGLGTAHAVSLVWAVPRFGVYRGPLVALVSGVLAYWLSFVVAYILGGCLLGLSFYFHWYTPPEDAQPSRPERGGGPASP